MLIYRLFGLGLIIVILIFCALLIKGASALEREIEVEKEEKTGDA